MTRPRFILCSARCHPDAWSGDDGDVYLIAHTPISKNGAWPIGGEIMRFGRRVEIAEGRRWRLVCVLCARLHLPMALALDVYIGDAEDGGPLTAMNSLYTTRWYLNRALQPLGLRIVSVEPRTRAGWIIVDTAQAARQAA